MRYQGGQRTWTFKNETGETVPPFALIIITGATDEDNEIVFSIRKPNATDEADQDASTFAINTGANVPTAGAGASGYGECVLSFPVLAVIDGTVSAGDSVGPVDDSWYLEPTGSALVCVVEDPTDAYSDGTKQTWLVQSLGGGGTKWYLGTLTTGWTGSTASADLADMDDNDLSTNVTVYDPLGTFASLGIGDRLEIKKIGNKHYTNQAPCPGA